MQQISLVCWGLVLLISSLEAADVKFISATSYFNPKYISNLTISIRKDPINSLNMDITLLQPILSDFYATIDLQTKLKDSVRYQSLFIENFDVCELVNNVFVDNLMKKWFKNLLKYGNLMENCPVPEGRYYLRELLIEQSSLAMYLRPGDYRITARGYFKKLNETMVGGVLDIKWIK